MRFRVGTIFSVALHAVVVVWALWNFTSVKPHDVQSEALPIDLVQISEVTKAKAGKVDAKEKMIAPVKQAEKKSDPTPVIDPTLPVKEKEVKATPPPPPTPVEEKVAKKDEPKPEEAKPDPTPSPDAIQKKLEEQPKKVEKKETPKKVVKQKTPPVKSKDFNPNEIAALLDRKQPSRKQNSGEQKSDATLGVPKGDQQMLSMDEIMALTRHVEKCWSVLPGVGNIQPGAVELRIRMNPDGTLAAQPQVLSNGSGSQAMAEGAVRAVIDCQPYKMLSAGKYNFWKDMIFNFAPAQSVRG